MSGTEDYEIPNLSGRVTLWSIKSVFNGQYSSVYHGRLEGQLVAVKVLKEIHGADAHTMRRKIHRERAVWGRLRHPNVLPLYGFAEDHELFQPFGALISPWRAQGNAYEFLKAKGETMSVYERLNLWKGVVTGVGYLHNHTPALVHGDLKPANVLIDTNGVPQICDFGLVSILLDEGTSGMTTTSLHTGTDRYLAYELVLDGEQATPTMASDVFALGGIGLEFFFLQQPYANRKNNMWGRICADIRAGISPAKRPAAEHCDHLSWQVWDLLDWCWARNTEERINARSLLTQLQTIAAIGHAIVPGKLQFLSSADRQNRAHTTLQHLLLPAHIAPELPSRPLPPQPASVYSLFNTINSPSGLPMPISSDSSNLNSTAPLGASHTNSSMNMNQGNLNSHYTGSNMNRSGYWASQDHQAQAQQPQPNIINFPPIFTNVGPTSLLSALPTDSNSSASGPNFSFTSAAGPGPGADVDSGYQSYSAFGTSTNARGQIPSSGGQIVRLPGACSVCKRLKMKCIFLEGKDCCRRCWTTGRAAQCLVEPRKTRQPSK